MALHRDSQLIFLSLCISFVCGQSLAQGSAEKTIQVPADFSTEVQESQESDEAISPLASPFPASSPEAEAAAPQALDDSLERLESELEVVWYRPEYGEPEKNRRPVLLSGKTVPGATVLIKGRKIPKINKDGTYETFSLQGKVRDLPAKADSDGLFAFRVFLPQGFYQIPVVLRHPQNNKALRVYQISFYVDKTKIRFAQKKQERNLEASPFLKKKNHISLGLGGNYLFYGKTADDGTIDLAFQSFSGPAYFVEYWRKINQRWEFAVNFKSSPGETASSPEDGIVVRQGTYEWYTTALDFIYFPKSWFWNKKDSFRAKWGARMGLQYHIVPFLRRTDVDQETEVVSNTLIMGALGLQTEIETSPDWRYEIFMRYQHPLSVGDVFEMSPIFAFDGSVGVQYNFPGHRWSLGTFWYGQIQTYQTTEFDLSALAESKGQQTLFFSNVELRLLYNF